jgi:hypothetical protein
LIKNADKLGIQMIISLVVLRLSTERWQEGFNTSRVPCKKKHTHTHTHTDIYIYIYFGRFKVVNYATSMIQLFSSSYDDACEMNIGADGDYEML